MPTEPPALSNRRLESKPIPSYKAVSAFRRSDVALVGLASTTRACSSAITGALTETN